MVAGVSLWLQMHRECEDRGVPNHRSADSLNTEHWTRQLQNVQKRNPHSLEPLRMARVGTEAQVTVSEFYPHAKVVITNKQLAFPLGTGLRQHTCVVGISVPTVQAIRQLQGRCCENEEWRRHVR